MRDPRDYQIAVLSGLLAYGTIFLSFDVTLARVALLMASAIGAQFLATRIWRLPRFDPKSALISSLSLALLLRTASPGLAALAAAITIFSKFLLRVDDRHVFNPTAFGLVAMLLLTDRAWVSPAQWGSSAFVAFLVACVGTLVIRRATRTDVTFAFLGCYVLILFGRTIWLDDPFAIAIHHLQSGSFLLFAFFMISDPKTTPSSAVGRMVWAGIVAAGAAFVHFVLYEPNGFLWSLIALAPTVPLFNRIFPGPAFSWSAADGSLTHQQGVTHVSPPSPARRAGRPRTAAV